MAKVSSVTIQSPTPPALASNGRAPLPVLQRLVKLANERAVQHVHQRQPHGQLGSPGLVDVFLPGERDGP